MFGRMAWVVLMLVVAGCDSGGYSNRFATTEAPPALALDGAPIRIEVESVPLCVGRRYIEPVPLKMLLDANKTVVTVGPVTSLDVRYHMDLQLFGEDLHAADDALYARLVEAGVSKPKYPEDWVRVSFIPQRVAAARTRPLQQRLERFETASFVDREFHSHRRHRDCPGKKAGAGCCMGIEEPPECVDYTLRYGHPVDPDAVLMCTTTRCYLDEPLTHADVHYQYDFPIQMLDRWPKLHSGIRSQIEQWRATVPAGPACQ